MIVEGSSPLTRGKLESAEHSVVVARLIPAHAGKTSCAWTTPRTITAHPRSRGENRVTGIEAHVRSGSSPLTRGKRGAARLAPWGRGLIPAHAGKTAAYVSVIGSGEAHPRSRGENPHLGYVEVYAQGSSPLTRGKRQRSRGRHQGNGLIPAHAGKTATA